MDSVYTRGISRGKPWLQRPIGRARNLVTVFWHLDENFPAACAEAYLVGRAARSEIKLSTLATKDLEKFVVAMEKEWKSWMSWSAVDILSAKDIARLPSDTRIISTQWVRTDNNAKRRAAGQDVEIDVKSRLVVVGCQEKDMGHLIRSDAPTGS